MLAEPLADAVLVENMAADRVSDLRIGFKFEQADTARHRPWIQGLSLGFLRSAVFFVTLHRHVFIDLFNGQAGLLAGEESLLILLLHGLILSSDLDHAIADQA